MAVNIQTILGTTTIPGLKDIANSNFAELKQVTEQFQNIYNSTSGTIDLTTTQNGILKLKSLEIPLGNVGITVGNTTVKDDTISTSVNTHDAIVEKTTSNLVVTFSANQVVTTELKHSNVVLNPTVSNLAITLAATPNGEIKTLDIVNLSATNDTCVLTSTSDFLDNANLNQISIPNLKNVRLKYVNSNTLNKKGWIIVSHNGCTIT